MPSSLRHPFTLLLALTALSAFRGGESRAATILWTGATDSFSAAGAWSGTNTPPISGDSLTFGEPGAGGLLLNNNLTSAAFNVAGMTFTAGAGAYVIGNGTATANAGNAFTLTGNVVNQSTSLQTINNPFSMMAVRTFTATAGGGNITLGGNISGSGGGITKLGAGTLTLGGTNTFTGATKVGEGTLALVNGASISGTSSLIVGDTGTSGLSLTGGSFISTTGFARLGVGGFSGTMRVDGADSALTVGDYLEVGYGDNGVINIADGGHVSAATNIALGVLAGNRGTVTVSGANSQLSATSTLYLGYGGTGSLTVDSGGVIDAGGQVLLGMLAGGAGTLHLNDNGTLQVGGTDGIARGAGAATINISGGHLVVTGSDLTTSLPMTISDTANIHTGALNATFSGALGGTGGLRKFDTGKLALTGNNTYAGGTTISGGTLQLGNGGTSGSITGNVANDGTLVINRSNSFEYSGVISGAGGLTIDGGAFRPTFAQTYTGPTQINAGYLVLPTAVDIGISPSSVVTLGAGGTLDLSNRAQRIAGLAGAGTVYSFGGSAGSLTLDVASGQTHNFSGTLGGGFANFAVAKSSAGTQIISGTNTYTGGTVVSGGTLLAGISSTTSGSGAGMTITGGPTGTGLLTVNGGTLDLSTFNLAVAGLAGSGGTIASSSTGTAGVLTIVASGTQNYSGTIADSIAGGTRPVTVNVAGSGTQIFSGTNTYTGGTTLTSGTLVLGSAGALGASGQLVFGGGTLRYSASNTTDYSSRFSSAPGQVVKIDTNGQTVTFASALPSPGGALTKSGAGTLILAAANTYPGTTTISSGTLQLGDGGTTGSLAPTGTITNNGMLAINRTGTATQGADFGAISGAGSLHVQSGTTILTAANSYTGGTNIASGATLRLGAGGATGSIAGNVTNNGLFVIARADNFTFAGNISGTGSVDLQGGGSNVSSLNLHGGNTYSGGTTVNAPGKFINVIGASTTAGSGAGMTIIAGPLGTGPLDLNDNARLSVYDLGGIAIGNLSGAPNSYIEGGGTLTIVTNGTSTFHGRIYDLNPNYPEDRFSVNIAGTGTQVFLANHDYSGTTTISSGTLQLGAGGATGSVRGNITNHGTVVINHSSDYTFSPIISGTGGLVSAGGILRLANIQTYTGPTQVNAGSTLVLTTSNQAISASSVVTILGAGALDFVNRAVTFAGLSGAGAVYSSAGSAGRLTLNVASGQTYDFSGNVGGAFPNFSITKVGSGTQILSASSAYTGATTISAGTLQLGNGGTAGSLNPASTIANNATLAFNRSNTVTQGIDFGAISGSGQVVQQGSGTLVLNGANTYSGATLVNSGTLKIAGSIGNTAVTIAAGATLSGEGSTGAAGNVTLNHGAFLSVDPNTPAALSIGGHLALNGTIGVVLGNAPASLGTGQTIRLLNYSGTLTGSAANLSAAGFRNALVSTATANQIDLTFDTKALTWLGSASAWDVNTTANWNAGADKFFSGDAVTFDDTGTIKTVTLNTAVVPLSVTFTNSAGNDYTLSGNGGVAGNGGITKSGSGTLTVSTMNTYTGATNINGGTLSLTATLADTAISTTGNGILSVTSTGAIGGASSLTVGGTGTSILASTNTYTGATVINGGTLQLGIGGMTGSLSPSSAITNNGTLIIDRSNPIVTQGVELGVISGSGNVIYQNSGTLILTAANTYGGGTTIASGTLQIGTGGPSGSLVGNVTNNGTVIFKRSDDYTFTGAISGIGEVMHNGHILRFSAAHTYTGATQIKSGVLVLPTTVDFALPNSTIVTVAEGASLDMSGRSQRIAGLKGGGGVYSFRSASSTLTLDIASGQTHDFTGILGGGDPNFGITKSGNGTQILSGTNNYTGATNIDGGILSLTGTLSGGTAISISGSGILSQSAKGAISGASSLYVGGSGTSILAGANTYNGGTAIGTGATLQLGIGGVTGSIPGNLINDGTLVFMRSDDFAFTGIIAGSGGVVQSGNILRFINPQAYTGPTSISTNAFLVLPTTANFGLAASTVVNLAAGAVLDLSSRTQRFAGLAGSGTVYSFNSSASTLTLDVPSGQTHTFSGNVGGNFANFAFTKTGPGTQILSGTNSYTQATAVNGGTLVVNGSISASSAVSVSAGATLRGRGRVSALSGAGLIDPNLEILTGAKVDPSGGLDFNFSLTQPGLPTFANASASGNDLLRLTDATPFTLALTETNVVTVDFTGVPLTIGQQYLGGFFLDANVPDSMLSNATFVYTGLSGIVQYDGLVTVPSAAFSTGTVTNGKVMQFTVVAVPEPGSASLALLGSLGLMLRRKRKKRD